MTLGGIGQQRGEQLARLVLHLNRKPLDPWARKAHTIINTYTFIHNHWQPAGKLGPT
jgi:hypothetical protein